MGSNKKLRVGALMLTTAGFLQSFSGQAATALKEEKPSVEFTADIPSHVLGVKAQSWYDPTMGYTGWTHTSRWGHMKLKKGKPVTIILETDVPGFHPALTVWSRPQKKGLAPINQMNSHSYNQFNDIYEANAVNNDDPANPLRIGKIQMEFISNAFDRDGMGDSLPPEFDQSMLNRVLDGKPGTVSLTFTPKVNGVYQFVVGGINPDVGVSTKADHPVSVTVSFPE